MDVCFNALAKDQYMQLKTDGAPVLGYLEATS